MPAFQHFIGVDLGGGKGRNTAVARLRATHGDERAKVEVVDYGTGKDTPFYDDKLIGYLLAQEDALVAIDAPLSLPACVRCTLPACPGRAACEEPIIRWFEGRSAEPAKKPRYTTYTQRATEVLLHEELGVLPRETLGQGMGPLTARAAYVQRALRPRYTVGENLIEVYPKATLHRLLGERLAQRYKRSAESPAARLEILNQLPELRFGPGAWREDALANDHKFDAILCAYTAYLYSRGACLPPPDERVASDGWIWVPAKAS